MICNEIDYVDDNIFVIFTYIYNIIYRSYFYIKRKQCDII